MESHRSRRTRDEARKAWYAYYRQVRFARWFGFIGRMPTSIRAFLLCRQRHARRSTNPVHYRNPI